MGSAERLAALEAVTELLELRPAGPSTRSEVVAVVGGRSGPRFLLPLDHLEATRSACLAYLGLRDLRTRANRTLVAGALASNAVRARVIDARLVLNREPGSLLAHLGQVLGRDDLVPAVGLGNLDEVWKPTLQLFAPDGEPIAYVKVGWGAIGAHLVEREAAALALWSRKEEPRLVVPRLISAPPWRKMPLACTAPLPGDVRRLPAGPVSAWGARTLDPPRADVPLSDSTWWTSRLEHHGDHPVVGPILGRINDRHARTPQSWARWHGDWVPWNLARSASGLVAWDWEYSEAAAPVGLDETHCAYQVTRVGRSATVDQALRSARRAAPSRWVADAHLAMLATRALELESIQGRPFGDHHQVLTAARAAIR